MDCTGYTYTENTPPRRNPSILDFLIKSVTQGIREQFFFLRKGLCQRRSCSTFLITFSPFIPLIIVMIQGSSVTADKFWPQSCITPPKQELTCGRPIIWFSECDVAFTFINQNKYKKPKLRLALTEALLLNNFWTPTVTTFAQNNLSYLHAEGFNLHKHICNHSEIKQNKKLGRFFVLDKDIQILLHGQFWELILHTAHLLFLWGKL